MTQHRRSRAPGKLALIELDPNFRAPTTAGLLRLGADGEILVRGGNVCMGYFRDPEGTAAVLTEDGWLRTHDTGYADEDGWFYFVDRSVNVIKRAGENISTSEVECVLTSHPLVAEAAVVGVPDPLRDWAVKAFVRLVPGACLPVAEMDAFCRTQLAAYKVPEVFDIVEDFPRTASMKIEKRLLH